MLTIKVKYFSDVEPIKFIGGKSDWYDLRSAEDVELKAGEFKLIKLGIGIALPKGYEAIVAPRSSTFKNYGIIQANSIGVIDESYCGDEDQWMFPAIALRDTVIHKNDRICQFRILSHQPEHEIVTVEHLNPVSRGGIGSTGKQ
ncbi:MAG: deoxyuridine 5'-triphosphate nucleotidohydrolase [Clostridia bacterium]|nr:deoxyuridine 5'-triphosphate nucleotidohydrolase [Clostridia bacterium]